VAETARQHMDRLRPAERKVARTLLADYPSAGLNTVADLALRAAVSAPTVVRCTQALGYDGFPALQAALRAELTQRSNGPLASVRREYEPGTVRERLLRHADDMLQRTLASFAAIPPSDIESTVALLAETSRPLYIVGGRFTHVLAEYLALLLEQLRPRVRYLTDPFGADQAQVLDVTRRDVYVLFDIARYQRDTLELAQELSKHRVGIVLLTDEQLSPVAAYADAVLPTAVVSPSVNPSMTAAMLLCELLVTPVMDRLGEPAHTRLALWEDSRAKHEQFLRDALVRSASWPLSSDEEST